MGRYAQLLQRLSHLTSFEEAMQGKCQHELADHLKLMPKLVQLLA